MVYRPDSPGVFIKSCVSYFAAGLIITNKKQHISMILEIDHILHDRYRVIDILGTPGGFGITYLAHDQILNVQVAIKEYFPRGICHRAPNGCGITCSDQGSADQLRKGITKFLDEARILASINHPNVVRIRDFFRDNGTGYIVMDYYNGLPLSDFISKNKEITEADAASIMLLIMNGLREVHDKGILHRDIKPSNIYLTTEGVPILLDFGAARQVLCDGNNSLSVILTEGYAPLEQYQRSGKQGVWTDVYSLGATLYFMLTGINPMSCVDRLNDDTSLVKNLSAKHRNIADIVIKAMSMSSDERYNSVATMQADLNACINPGGRIITNTNTKRSRPTYREIALAIVSSSLLLIYISNPSLDVVHGLLPKALTEINTNKTDVAHAISLITGPAELRDYPAAFNEFKLLADSDIIEGINWSAWMYLNGWGVVKDRDAAKALFKKSADKGDSYGLYNYALLLTIEDDTIPSALRALPYITRSAKNSYPPAEYALAMYNLQGIGMPESNNDAATWFIKSAEHGYLDARFELALDKLFGIWSERDTLSAEKMLRALAKDSHYTRAEMVLRDYFEPGGEECNHPLKGGGFRTHEYCGDLRSLDPKPSEMNLKPSPPPDYQKF